MWHRLAVVCETHKLDAEVCDQYCLFPGPGSTFYLGREDHCWPTHLDLVGKFPEESIGPALIAPYWHEGPANACIHGDEALVLHPQAILGEHLSNRTDVVARVLPLDDFDVLQVARHEIRGVGEAVEDEDEVGGGVDAPLDEKLQVLSRVRVVCVHEDD